MKGQSVETVVMVAVMGITMLLVISIFGGVLDSLPVSANNTSPQGVSKEMLDTMFNIILVIVFLIPILLIAKLFLSGIGGTDESEDEEEEDEEPKAPETKEYGNRIKESKKDWGSRPTKQPQDYKERMKKNQRS